MCYASDYICNENTVIIGRKGNINQPILVKTKFWNVDTAFGLEPKKDYINSDYLYQFCEFYDFEKLNKTVTIPSLTKYDLLKIKIPVPPITLQNQFAEFVKLIDKLKFSVEEQLKEAQNLLNSRMQKYFG
jgi:type I restriction enzyme S subunit